MRRTEIGLFLMMLILVASCKKNNEVETKAPETKEVKVSTTDLLFKGDLDHDASIAQSKGEVLRILAPYMEKEKRVGSRYRLNEYARDGRLLKTGNVYSLEPLTKETDLFKISIDNKGAALLRQKEKGQFKDAVNEKIRAKRKTENGNTETGLGEVLSLYAGCQDASPVCIDWYWVTYDLYTGNVESENFLYTSCYDPCSFNSGGSGGSNDTNCSEATSKIKSGPISVGLPVVLEQEGSNVRTFTYPWQFHRQIYNMWHYKSFEKGVHKKHTDGKWRWESLTHMGVVRIGIVLGSTVECIVTSAVPQVGIYHAGMQLNYRIESSAICKGFPLSNSKNYYGNSPIWHVDERPPLF